MVENSHPLTLGRLTEQAPECTCFNLRKAARAVTQYYDGVLKPSGLRATQFTLLVAIYNAGPVTIKRLAERLVMDRTTLTRNLKPLQKQGLITITSGEDRRTRAVELTERGREALTQALPQWEQAQAQVVGRLGRERWRDLLGHLSATVALTRAS